MKLGQDIIYLQKQVFELQFGRLHQTEAQMCLLCGEEPCRAPLRPVSNRFANMRRGDDSQGFVFWRPTTDVLPSQTKHVCLRIDML